MSRMRILGEKTGSFQMSFPSLVSAYHEFSVRTAESGGRIAGSMIAFFCLDLSF